VTNLSLCRGCDAGIDQLGRYRLESGQCKTGGRRQEDEVARFEHEEVLTINGQAAASLDNCAEAGMAKGGIADTPRAGTADALREDGARLQQ